MQQFIGRVIQAARNKIAKVAVERSVKQKNYEKAVKTTKNYFVQDEFNSASVGDIVEIVYQGGCHAKTKFKINQTIKESQKYRNPVNGPFSMVLPWASDRRSPALRYGLLGCPFFNTVNNDILFAIDERYKLNLKQSEFVSLQKPVTNTKRHPNTLILNLRKDHNDTYVPSSLLLDCMNEFDLESPTDNFLSQMIFKKNPNYTGQYIAVYPSFSKDDLRVDFLNEIELDSNQVILNIFDRQNINFPFEIKNIRSFSGDSFAVSSSQTAMLFSNSIDSFRPVFEYISPDDDYISYMDICRFDAEISVILKNAKKLVIISENSSSEFGLSADYSICSYSTHPSLLLLSGSTNKIELKDLRDTFPGMSISDRNVPFHSVQALITHRTDPNLLAISCHTETFNPIDNCDSLTPEIRIYDIRFPKESTIRIASDSSISQFISFESYADIEHDCLFGLDTQSAPWYWELRHSKPNDKFTDGILSLTDHYKLSRSNNIQISADRDFIGYSIDCSYSHKETMFLARLTDDGELEYCKFTNNENIIPHELIFSDEIIGEILDFSTLSEIQPKQNLKTNPRQTNADANNFGPMFQSTFHLDFYWDELKAKLIENGNQ